MEIPRLLSLFAEAEIFQERDRAVIFKAKPAPFTFQKVQKPSQF